MKNNPLVDCLAILICILAVVLVGQYYIAKKDREVSLQKVEKRLDQRIDKARPKYVDMSKFESAVKHTE